VKHLLYLATPIFLLLLGVAACSTTISRVDLKYTSDAHLKPAERFLVIKQPPHAIGERVRQFITKSAGTIMEQQEHLSFRYAPHPQGEENWVASRVVFEKEWEAYKKNDIRIYEAIDRKDPKLTIPQTVREDDAKADASFMRASLAPRLGESERNLNHLVGLIGVFSLIHWKRDEKIDTILYVWWWRQNDGTTKVYARAVPHMIEYNVEAAPGAWALYDLWPATTGAADADIVLRLFAFLKGDDGAATPLKPTAASS
jgi:hypothetical protein